MTFYFFFFNDTATTEIYTLSLHDALPISIAGVYPTGSTFKPIVAEAALSTGAITPSTPLLCSGRSEEHTSELQSLAYLVCRLLLEKKKKKLHTGLLRHIIVKALIRSMHYL